MAIIHGRDITLCPSPVPRNCSGDGGDGQLGDAMSKGSLVRKPDPGATDPPNGAEGGDAKEVPVTKEGSVGGFLRPMERVVGKEDTWKAGDIKASLSVPRSSVLCLLSFVLCRLVSFAVPRIVICSSSLKKKKKKVSSLPTTRSIGRRNPPPLPSFVTGTSSASPPSAPFGGSAAPGSGFRTKELLLIASPS